MEYFWQYSTFLRICEKILENDLLSFWSSIWIKFWQCVSLCVCVRGGGGWGVDRRKLHHLKTLMKLSCSSRTFSMILSSPLQNDPWVAVWVIHDWWLIIGTSTWKCENYSRFLLSLQDKMNQPCMSRTWNEINEKGQQKKEIKLRDSQTWKELTD